MLCIIISVGCFMGNFRPIERSQKRNSSLTFSPSALKIKIKFDHLDFHFFNANLFMKLSNSCVAYCIVQIHFIIICHEHWTNAKHIIIYLCDEAALKLQRILSVLLPPSGFLGWNSQSVNIRCICYCKRVSDKLV